MANLLLLNTNISLVSSLFSVWNHNKLFLKYAIRNLDSPKNLKYHYKHLWILTHSVESSQEDEQVSLDLTNWSVQMWVRGQNDSSNTSLEQSEHPEMLLETIIRIYCIPLISWRVANRRMNGMKDEEVIGMDWRSLTFSPFISSSLHFLIPPTSKISLFHFLTKRKKGMRTKRNEWEEWPSYLY